MLLAEHGCEESKGAGSLLRGIRFVDAHHERRERRARANGTAPADAAGSASGAHRASARAPTRRTPANRDDASRAHGGTQRPGSLTRART